MLGYFFMNRELKHNSDLLVTESYLIQVRGFPEESADLIPPFFSASSSAMQADGAPFLISATLC